jgi:hypothetical protein
VKIDNDNLRECSEPLRLAAVLLHLIDPGRGDRTRHGVDQDIPEFRTSRERILKRKFLGSFAVKFATKKGVTAYRRLAWRKGNSKGRSFGLRSTQE